VISLKYVLLYKHILMKAKLQRYNHVPYQLSNNQCYKHKAFLCDDDIGCNEIYDGNTLYIEMYKGKTFTATIYKKQTLSYFADKY
jgi:hypothetical protein